MLKFAARLRCLGVLRILLSLLFLQSTMDNCPPNMEVLRLKSPTNFSAKNLNRLVLGRCVRFLDYMGTYQSTPSNSRDVSD